MVYVQGGGGGRGVLLVWHRGRCCLQYGGPPGLEAPGLSSGHLSFRVEPCVPLLTKVLQLMPPEGIGVPLGLYGFLSIVKGPYSTHFQICIFHLGDRGLSVHDPKKHFQNASLENSIFSHPLTASSGVLPRA